MLKLFLNAIINQLLTAEIGKELFGGKVKILDKQEKFVVAQLNFKKMGYMVTITKIEPEILDAMNAKNNFK